VSIEYIFLSVFGLNLKRSAFFQFSVISVSISTFQFLISDNLGMINQREVYLKDC